MDEKTILNQARACFRKVADMAYPEGFLIGSWWAGIQQKNRAAIEGFSSPAEAILYAQDGFRSGFDHREINLERNLHFVLTRMAELERCFPGLRFDATPVLQESVFSNSKSIVRVNGIPYSNIFLTHVNFCLRSMWTSRLGDNLNRIVEIGGGYGGLARIFRLIKPNVKYVITDMPESLFYAHVFLQANFPDAKIGYINGEDPVEIDKYDFVLVPAQLSGRLAGQRFDLAINTGSLQEMPNSTVQYWMDFLQKKILAAFFYSFNYFLNNKGDYAETSLEQGNLICPILDQFWSCRYFRINPAVVTADCCGRNWLEVVLERIVPAAEDTQTSWDQKFKTHSEFLCGIEKYYHLAGEDWFQTLWMAFWYNPTPAIARRMLEGIEAYRQGKGARQFVTAPKFGEEVYYEAFLSQAKGSG